MATLTVDREMIVASANPPRPFSPRIKNGDTLADRYATKAALQWINSLRVRIDHSIDRLEAFRFGPYGTRPANPIAQRKWIARAKEALGPSLLSHSFEPGTRGRGAFSLDILGTAPNDHPAYGCGAHAPRRWVKMFRIEGKWQGIARPLALDARDIATFSTHAACRLIQRGGVESEAELREVLRAMLPRLSTVEALTRERRTLQFGDQWVIPVVVKDRVLIGVFMGPGRGGDEERLLAKTFLTVEMLFPDQLTPVRRLVEALATGDDLASAVEGARVRQSKKWKRNSGGLSVNEE